MNIELYALYD